MNYDMEQLVHVFETIEVQEIETCLDRADKDKWELVLVTSYPLTLYFERKKQHDS